ncbi:MAG: efflux RND transporter periplasmic adaptor subunit [Casimicrobiaceae bacterium]
MPMLRVAGGPRIVALAAAIVLVAACGRDAKTDAAKPPIDVTVMTTVARDVPVTPIYVAQTQSSQAVNIQARVSGFLDQRVYREGSVVKKGQVLFQMDQKPFQAQLDAQKASMQRNQAALEVAKANLARTKPLTEQNALSQKDLDDAQGQYEQSAAAVEQSKAQVQEAQLNLSYTTIVSPVTGVSSFAAVADGTYLSPQNSQLTTVSVLTPMWINFSVSENELERVRDSVKKGALKLPQGGQFVVEIEMVDGSIFPFTGRITFADPSYNSATGTFLLRATVDNPDGVLRPNQYVRTRLKGAILPNAIVVPQRAVQQSAKGHFVWVVSKDNKAELRPVEVGDWNNEDWVISSGLKAGESVVVDGGVRLAGGADVKATAYQAPASATAPKPVPSPLAGVGVRFARDSAVLDADALGLVRAHAAAVMGIGTAITITGYADGSGNVAAHAELAKRRAAAVRDALVANGVNPQRIRMLPPVTVTGSGADDEARRVDIAVAQ